MSASSVGGGDPNAANGNWGSLLGAPSSFSSSGHEIGAISGAIGGVIGAIGSIVGNQGKAQAASTDAAYYAEQAQFAQTTGGRERDVFIRQADTAMSRQQSTYESGGVSASSGSPLAVREYEELIKQKEIGAINEMTAQKVLMATTKEQAAQTQANTYGSLWYNGLTVGTDLLKAAPLAAAIL